LQYYTDMHNAPATAAAANVLGTLATLHANGYSIDRATAYRMRHNARRKAFNLRRVARAARTYYANVAIARVIAHSKAQFAAAQRYGVNW
jgi:hypothetical protein